MSDTVSIHNSRKELEQTPELIRELNLHQSEFQGLPYCEYVSGEDLPGKFSLLIFLHGIGSVGSDNFLQVRMPAPPLVDFCRRKKLKTILLFPQCPAGAQWVNVPWNTNAHDMPEKPSDHMRLAMELLNVKIREFSVDSARISGSGVSMGGYGIWDMACRMPRTFSSLAVICGGADVKQAEKLKQMKIYIIHGNEDSAVPVFRARSMAAALRNAGNAHVIYRELPEVGHNAWDSFFADDDGMNHCFL